MIDVFKARLKAKTLAAGVNLSKDRIAVLADRLHKKFPELTEEADHDKEVDLLDELISFADIAKEDDRVRTLEKKLEKTEPPKPTDPKPTDPPKPDDEPAWFKAYREANDAKLNGLLQEKQQQSLQQKLKAHEKLKDIPEKFWNKRALPKTDEEIEAFAEEAFNDYSEIVPPQQDQAFIPGVGKRQKVDSKPSKTEIDGILGKIMRT